MEEFNTLEKVENLFRSINGIGYRNCYFICYRNTTKDGMKYGAFGAVGGAVGAVAALSTGLMDGMKKDSDGYLINYTENGLAIIPLDATGVMLTLTPAKLKPNLNACFFLKNEEIESIVVKKYNIFNSGTKKIIITTKNNQKLNLIARVTEKLIPYQKENITIFAETYKK